MHENKLKLNDEKTEAICFAPPSFGLVYSLSDSISFGSCNIQLRISCISELRELMRSLVTSLFLYVCESWTLTAEIQRRIQAMEMRCYLKILCISYKDHVANEEVRAKIQLAIGPHEDLLTIVKRRKLQWHAHVSRSSGLAKTILQGTVKRWKKTRHTEEEVGRQHQGMDRPGGQQVPEGSGERKNGENWLQNHLWCPNDPRG